jgi:hypothetical protein
MLADGCTAGPLSDWLNGLIGVCCDLHDAALDHSFDLGTFVQGNVDFARCVWAVNPLLAFVLFLAVSGPVGAALYWFGPKRKFEGDTSK